MMTPRESLEPSKKRFGDDPLGYSALAWHRWATVQNMAGFPVDLEQGPSSEDLKNPVLWLSHAHAMSEAARVLLQGSPDLTAMPKEIWGICHCQYYAVALMTVGYSLEVSLKGMMILEKGIEAYQAEEKDHFHHRLEKLADFIPGLSEKDKGILKGLSHFVRWAGRYPDPGFGKESHAEEIFTLSETHRITATDVFELASRIMKHVNVVLGDAQ